MEVDEPFHLAVWRHLGDLVCRWRRGAAGNSLANQPSDSRLPAREPARCSTLYRDRAPGVLARPGILHGRARECRAGAGRGL